MAAEVPLGDGQPGLAELGGRLGNSPAQSAVMRRPCRMRDRAAAATPPGTAPRTPGGRSTPRGPAGPARLPAPAGRSTRSTGRDAAARAATAAPRRCRGCGGPGRRAVPGCGPRRPRRPRRGRRTGLTMDWRASRKLAGEPPRRRPGCPAMARRIAASRRGTASQMTMSAPNACALPGSGASAGRGAMPAVLPGVDVSVMSSPRVSWYPASWVALSRTRPVAKDPPARIRSRPELSGAMVRARAG